MRMYSPLLEVTKISEPLTLHLTKYFLVAKLYADPPLTEREVKKANRDLTQQLSAYSSPLARADAIQKKYTKLYGDMKRLERENQKNKKRADTLQKEKDSAKSELNKTNGLKEKLEKLSRETNNENRKLRVCAVRSEGCRPLTVTA